jgi:hypothetical protein
MQIIQKHYQNNEYFNYRNISTNRVVIFLLLLPVYFYNMTTITYYNGAI